MKTHFFKTLILLICINICSCDKESNSVKICSDYSSDPISELPIGLIEDMVKGYKDNQYKAINSNLHMTDARAITFDLETLKKFIYHIETISKQNDSNVSSESLGIRIYYAAYPEFEKWNDPRYQNSLDPLMGNSITERYGEKHTILIVPTIKRNEIAHDFNPKDIRTYDVPLQQVVSDQGSLDYSDPRMSLMSLSTTSKQTTSRTSLTSSTSTPAQNHGGLFPPKTDEGLGF